MATVGRLVVIGGVAVLGVAWVVSLLVGVPLGALLSGAIDTSSGPKSTPEPLRIAVVDDAPDVLATTVGLLTDFLEIPVDGFASCGLLLSWLDGQPSLQYRLVILDYDMPGLTGPQCISLIRERMNQRGTHTVYGGMSGQRENEAEFLAAGASFFIYKGGGGIFNQLMSVVKQALSQP